MTARWDRWLVIAVFGAMGLIVVASFLMAASVASDHAYFHVMFGLTGAIPAGILASRREPALWRSIAIAGLALLAVTQLVEAVGAWGFGPDNDTVVSPIKALHDLGVAISPIGLFGAVAALAVAMAVALRARGQGMLAIAAAGGIAVVGLFLVAKLIGIG
jgi:hypothetical protein